MRCPCADSVLIIILGLVIALVGIFSTITHATLNSNLHPIVHCVAILLFVSRLCWIFFKSCSKLDEIHEKLQVQPPSESHREKERKRTKRKKKKKRPSRLNQPVQPPSHHEPSNKTHPKKPNATKKKAKKGELGHRAWCVFEANTAEHSDETQMYFMLPSGEQQKLIDEILLTNKGPAYASNKLFDALRSVEIEDADASKEQDKINILKLVERTGGAAKLNHAVNDRLREWQLKVVREGCERLESESKDVGTDVDLARCFLNAGAIFRDRGCFDEALDFLWKSLKIRESVLGNDHEDTASIYHSIASVYDDQGKYDDALTYYLKALTIYEKILGKYHPSTATTCTNIGRVYSNQGKYNNALTYFLKCLTICEKIFGKEHQDTATTYNNIGLVYDNQGKYNDALTYYRKSLTIYEKILGKNHQSTATTYNNMAVVYRKQGKYDDALTYYRKALTIREKVFGKEHLNTASTYFNIGYNYECQGNLSNALQYYEKCLSIFEKILGSDHQETQWTKSKVVKLTKQLKKKQTKLNH